MYTQKTPVLAASVHRSVRLDSAAWNFLSLCPSRHGRPVHCSYKNPGCIYPEKKYVMQFQDRKQLDWDWKCHTSHTQISAICNFIFSIKKTLYNYLMSETWERNKDFNLNEINSVITSLQIPYEIVTMRFRFYLKPACCICSVPVYLITVQNKTLFNPCQMSAIPTASVCVFSLVCSLTVSLFTLDLQ